MYILGRMTSLLIRERKINTTMRYLCTLTMMTKVWVFARMGWPCWKCTDGSHQHNTGGDKPDTGKTHSKSVFLPSSKARLRRVYWEGHDGDFWDGGACSRSFLTWCWFHGCHQLVKFMELIMCNLCVFLHVYKTSVKIPLRKYFCVHSLH